MKRNEKKIKSYEMMLFTRQLATLLMAGIPLAEALSLLSKNAFSMTFERLILKLKKQVENGRLFSSTLKLHPLVFDEFYCSLIKAGEHSGTLDILLDRLATYQEKKESLKRKIKKALYYPLCVLLIAFLITGFLLIKVVPTFKEIFEGLGSTLPWFTQWVLNLSSHLANMGLGFSLILACLGIWMNRRYQSQPHFRLFIHQYLLKFPILGGILKKIAIARLTRVLCTTTAAGVPLMEALETALCSSGNPVFTNTLLSLKKSLAAGHPLWMALKKNPIFPMMMVQMVRIGEESGSLEKLLNKIATLYEEEANTEIDGLTSLLEPIIMVCLGFMIGGLIIALYLPIFNMGSIL